jgi:hypothetical protein
MSCTRSTNLEEVPILLPKPETEYFEPDENGRKLGLWKLPLSLYRNEDGSVTLCE